MKYSSQNTIFIPLTYSNRYQFTHIVRNHCRAFFFKKRTFSSHTIISHLQKINTIIPIFFKCIRTIDVNKEKIHLRKTMKSEILFENETHTTESFRRLINRNQLHGSSIFTNILMRMPYLSPAERYKNKHCIRVVANTQAHTFKGAHTHISQCVQGLCRSKKTYKSHRQRLERSRRVKNNLLVHIFIGNTFLLSTTRILFSNYYYLFSLFNIWRREIT